MCKPRKAEPDSVAGGEATAAAERGVHSWGEEGWSIGSEFQARELISSDPRV